jgi:sugar-specific transcriptional regulator TrmB
MVLAEVKRRRKVTAREIASVTGIPQIYVYPRLRRLRHLGLIGCDLNRTEHGYKVYFPV